MNKRIFMHLLFFIMITAILFSGCKKGDLPEVVTSELTYVLTTATCGGNVTTDRGSEVTARGVCWSTNSNPTINDSKTTDGSGTGIYTSQINGLAENTTYYVRAYATSKTGTSYGYNEIFTTFLSYDHNYAGGQIFYIDNTGQHGLVCATTDQNNGTDWGCLLTEIGGTSTEINTGAANTNTIVTGCTSAGIAAKLCFDLILNGYNDWYLPSQAELDLMYTNLKAQGMGNFFNTYYWSSSEFNSGYAWAQDFNDGSHIHPVKTNPCYVRAVRSF